MALCSNPCDQVGKLLESPWSNPKLTMGQACDIRIKEARQVVEKLCIQKAKIEAMGWIDLPYHEVRGLINMEGYPY